MCGRYVLATPPDTLASLFGVAPPQDLAPRYNIAPTQPTPVVRSTSEGRGREITTMRWGLIPHWADDPSELKSDLINARAETAAKSPAFRAAFNRRRCLVPADGFYEWRQPEGGGRKQPYFVHLRSGDPMAFAGLWERWEDADGTPVETFTILTTDANDALKQIHNRMPVVVLPEDFNTWLQADVDSDPDAVRPLLKPCPSDLTEHYPISTRVNNPRHDDPSILEPIEAEGEDPQQTMFNG